MIITLIYKEYFDRHGQPSDIELIECDDNKIAATKFTKLYNLQIPRDMKDNVIYKSVELRIADKYAEAPTYKYGNYVRGEAGAPPRINFNDLNMVFPAPGPAPVPVAPPARRAPQNNQIFYQAPVAPRVQFNAPVAPAIPAVYDPPMHQNEQWAQVDNFVEEDPQ